MDNSNKVSVSLSEILANIEEKQFYNFPNIQHTVCYLKLKNGYSVMGECFGGALNEGSPNGANYLAEVNAFENALEKAHSYMVFEKVAKANKVVKEFEIKFSTDASVLKTQVLWAGSPDGPGCPENAMVDEDYMGNFNPQVGGLYMEKADGTKGYLEPVFIKHHTNENAG